MLQKSRVAGCGPRHAPGRRGGRLAVEDRVQDGRADGVDVGLGDGADHRLAGLADQRPELVLDELLAVLAAAGDDFRHVDRADDADEVEEAMANDK